MPSRFPVSDHCDGARFFNPTGRQAPPFRWLPKWWWQRLRGQGTWWPRNVPPPRQPLLPADVAAGSVATTFIGHATFLLQFPGLTVLTDPVFSKHAGPFGLLGPKRARPPALRLDELPPVDVVVLSHNHYDHLDLSSLRWLGRERRPLIITTLGNKAWLEARGVTRVVELDWWQQHDASGCRFTCTPAQHFAARALWDKGRTLWGGFWIKHADGAVYFCGDSGWGPHFAQIRENLGAPDLALLPIGAYEPRWFMENVHMTPEESVQAHLALAARRSVGMHFGTFQLTDEGIDDPVRALAAVRDHHGVPAEVFDTLDFGETRMLPLGG